MQIAVIGAGLAGLACAEQLRESGHAPILFEKSRGVGGRMSTRRVEIDHGQVGFDHGAQYMTVRDPGFVRLVQSWQAAGLAAPWPAAGDDSWVGVPGMNAPARAMADRFDVRRGQRVTALEAWPDGWHLRLADEQETAGPFAAAIVAVPAEQAGPLLAAIAPDWSALALATRSSPCWTVMAAFAARLPLETDVIKKRGPIGWAARNSAKPGRSGPEAWVIQADADWSAANLEMTAEQAQDRLLRIFAETTGLDLPQTLSLSAHRWRYAKSGTAERGTAERGTAERTALWDPDRRLGVCGDWLLGPRVESAFLSGTGLAAMMSAQAG